MPVDRDSLLAFQVICPGPWTYRGERVTVSMFGHPEGHCDFCGKSDLHVVHDLVGSDGSTASVGGTCIANVVIAGSRIAERIKARERRARRLVASVVTSGMVAEAMVALADPEVCTRLGRLAPDIGRRHNNRLDEVRHLLDGVDRYSDEVLRRACRCVLRCTGATRLRGHLRAADYRDQVRAAREVAG